MPRIFNRVISFDIQGEIYDNKSSAESIINKYSWSFHKDYNANPSEIAIIGKHKDNRGNIVKAVKLAKIKKSSIKDTNYFLV